MIRDALRGRGGQDGPAVLGRTPVSYAELAQRADALQAALPSAAERPAAALLLTDGADFLAALFAVLQAGWTAFPISSRLSTDELAELLRQAPVGLAVTSAQLYRRCQAALAACGKAVPQIGRAHV